eukprot:gene16744-8749_t
MFYMLNSVLRTLLLGNLTISAPGRWGGLAVVDDSCGAEEGEAAVGA